MDRRPTPSILAPDVRRMLSVRGDGPGLRHLVVHLGAIAGLGAGIVVRVPAWPLLLPLQGVALVFLFTLEHECTHRTPFRTPWLNECAGRAGGFVILLPFSWFRWFHLAHHRHTNDPEHDPELATPKPGSWRALAWYVSGVPYWVGEVRLLVRLARGREVAPFLPDTAHTSLARGARVALAGYAASAATLAVSPALLWAWFVPVLLGQPFLRCYLLAEHGDRPHVADRFRSTRTMSTTAAVRYTAWNMPYHTEHHVYPGVPFHRLPALHRELRAELVDADDGYVRFLLGYLGRRRGN